MYINILGQDQVKVFYNETAGKLMYCSWCTKKYGPDMTRTMLFMTKDISTRRRGGGERGIYGRLVKREWAD